jgi:hypothetical protein
MKFRKSRPSIAVSMGRIIVLSIPNRPEASPGKKNSRCECPFLGRHDEPPSTLGVPMFER